MSYLRIEAARVGCTHCDHRRPLPSAVRRFSPTMRWRSSASCTAASAHAATSCSLAAVSAATRWRATGRLDFLADTKDVRDGDWTVAAAPADLVDRRVEITGPTEPKMAINALNTAPGSGSPISKTPTLRTGTTSSAGSCRCMTRSGASSTFTSPEGKEYALRRRPARGHRGPPARLALRRAAPAGRR